MAPQERCGPHFPTTGAGQLAPSGGGGFTTSRPGNFDSQQAWSRPASTAFRTVSVHKRTEATPPPSESNFNRNQQQPPPLATSPMRPSEAIGSPHFLPVPSQPMPAGYSYSGVPYGYLPQSSAQEYWQQRQRQAFFVPQQQQFYSHEQGYAFGPTVHQVMVPYAQHTAQHQSLPGSFAQMQAMSPVSEPVSTDNSSPRGIVAHNQSQMRPNNLNNHAQPAQNAQNSSRGNARASQSANTVQSGRVEKQKRTRASTVRKRMSSPQTVALEDLFNSNPKPSSATQKNIAQTLDVSFERVQIWFQNRRAKHKRESRASRSPSRHSTASSQASPGQSVSDAEAAEALTMVGVSIRHDASSVASSQSYRMSLPHEQPGPYRPATSNDFSGTR
eukprot:Opistho-2@84251